MQFHDPALQKACDGMQAHTSPAYWAVADNFAFEERVPDDRRVAYEAVQDAKEFENSHREYLRTRVRVAGSDTFAPPHASRLQAEPENEVGLLRVEDVGDRLTPGYGASIEDACDRLNQDIRNMRAGDPEARQRLSSFLNSWLDHPKRDRRPTFVADISGVQDAADAADWPWRLSARLGLARYRVAGSWPWALLQLRYRAGDVVAARPDMDLRFVAPTVIDSAWSQYFFPAPRLAAAADARVTDGGRAFDLAMAGPPVAEFLHPPIRYSPDHLYEVKPLNPSTDPGDDNHFETKRDHHLEEVRRLAKRPDFGDLRTAP